jgi:hypothetical protein
MGSEQNDMSDGRRRTSEEGRRDVNRYVKYLHERWGVGRGNAWGMPHFEKLGRNVCLMQQEFQVIGLHVSLRERVE